MCKTEWHLEENQKSYRLEKQKPQKISLYKQLNIK